MNYRTEHYADPAAIDRDDLTIRYFPGLTAAQAFARRTSARVKESCYVVGFDGDGDKCHWHYYMGALDYVDRFAE